LRYGGLLAPAPAPCEGRRRTRTRALAARVWVRRSSVDHRIEHVGRRHLHDPPAIHHPAVQFISRRDPARAAALRVDVVTDGAGSQTLRCRGAAGHEPELRGEPWADRCGRRTRRRGRRPGHPLHANAMTRGGEDAQEVWDRQRARQRCGLGLERDKLHGRVVDRRRVVEMAPPSMLDSVVNGRASGPRPAAPARVSAFSPKRVAWSSRAGLFPWLRRTLPRGASARVRVLLELTARTAPQAIKSSAARYQGHRARRGRGA
jgi:hypothetical protein